MKKLKKLMALTIISAMSLSLFAGCSGEQSGKQDGKNEEVTLRVYNWGEYIAEGVLDEFTEKTGIKVEYDVFTDNESMYTKVKNSGDSYDVVVPSDYMIKQMAQEGMLSALNFNNIPNYQYLDPDFKSLSYDPENKYSVPYLWGTVGILYNQDKTGRELTSMRDLWDPALARKVCMLDSLRDTIGMTLKMLGYSINDTDPAHVNEAKQLLLEQKPRVLAYGTDEISPKVIQGTAAAALVFSGEGISATEESDNIKFVIPKEGSNLAVDGFVVLKTSKYQKEAEAFINFMMDPEIALRNTTETGYSTTNSAAYDKLDEELKSDPGRYPPADVMSKLEVFETFTADNKTYVDAWDEIKAK